MKKSIISLVLACTFVFSTVFSANAASYTTNGRAKTPTALTYKDVSRLAEIASNVRGKKCAVVNAQRYNGSSTTWVVRLGFDYDQGGDQCNADFVINCYPYDRDPKTQQLISLPFANTEEGTAMFGPCWYYFGLFDDKDHNSCGFAVAERIKRWPDWKDYTFSGVTYRGVAYTGSYNEANDNDFIPNHINN